jgi:hypothetical protein
MKMDECTKFDKCSAPVCPLYKSVNEQEHLENESACHYLLEAQKMHSEAIFDQSGLGDLYRVMVRATHEVFAQPENHKYLQKQLLKAATSGSRMARGLNLTKNRKSK